MNEPSILRKGAIVDGRFEIIKVLGTGGQGIVYQARQSHLNRMVALKMMRQEGSCDEMYLKRFEREAQLLSTLRHPNINGFYLYGFWHGRIRYLVTELIEGKTLASLINDEGTLPWRRAVNIAIQACAGLHCAHQNNVIHRDIKPENIFVLQVNHTECVKITDFGLAKLLELPDGPASSQTLTEEGMTVGTAEYMSPEQVRGKVVSESSDLYSLGCTLYACIFGRPPFEGNGTFDVLCQHLSERVTFPDTAPDIPQELVDVLEVALAKSPQSRYSSALEFSKALEQVANAAPTDVKSGKKRRLRKSAPSQFAVKLSQVRIYMYVLLIIASGSLAMFSMGPQHSHKQSARVEIRSIELAREEANKDYDRFLTTHWQNRLQEAEARRASVFKLLKAIDETAKLPGHEAQLSMAADEAAHYLEEFDLELAQHYIRKSMAWAKLAWGSKSKNYADKLSNLADKLCAAGNHKGAMEVLQEQLTLMQSENMPVPLVYSHLAKEAKDLNQLENCHKYARIAQSLYTNWPDQTQISAADLFSCKLMLDDKEYRKCSETAEGSIQRLKQWLEAYVGYGDTLDAFSLMVDLSCVQMQAAIRMNDQKLESKVCREIQALQSKARFPSECLAQYEMIRAQEYYLRATTGSPNEKTLETKKLAVSMVLEALSGARSSGLISAAQLEKARVELSSIDLSNPRSEEQGKDHFLRAVDVLKNSLH